MSLKQPRRRPIVALLGIVLALSVCVVEARINAELADGEEFRCIHDKLQSPLALRSQGFDLTSRIIPSTMSASASIARVAGPQPLRIALSTLDLDDPTKVCTRAGATVEDMQGGSVTCRSSDVLTANRKASLLTKVLPEAVKMHMERLNVNRYVGNIQVTGMPAGICSSFTVPAAHATTGVNADMVMYVSGAPAGTGVIAWATSCLRGPDDRPTVGVINFGPAYIDDSRMTIRVAAHEMAHALGFSNEYFNSVGIAASTVSIRGKTTTQLQSPKVVEMARAQYGCVTMTGMELEDEGGPGTANSHWERRNARDELMAGISGIGFYTALTLALFEDTGKYFPNYDLAEPMLWGQNAGCGLINNKCVINGVSQFPAMFCTDETQDSCTSDFMGYGYCSLGVFSSSFPVAFRYFSDPTIGGTAGLMDYCPVVVSYSNRQCASTQYASQEPSFRFGPTSRCLNGRSINYNGRSFPEGVCLQVLCNTSSSGAPQVMIRPRGRDWIPCPAGGAAGEVSITGGGFRSGYVTCPAYRDICVTDEVFDEALSDAYNGVMGRDGHTILALMIMVLALAYSV